MSDSIFGHKWEDIQRAQRGGRLHRTVDASRPIDHSLSDADRELIAQYKTIDALAAAGFHGTADRLKRANGEST